MFEDISKLKVADLKRELKERNLSATGNKQELYDRLKEAVQFGVKGSSNSVTLKSPASHSGGESEDEDDELEGVADLNSDILPDEEEELDEDNLLNPPPPLNEFPSSTTTTTTNSLNLLKRKSDQQVSSSSESLSQPKRISLGQHSKITFDSNNTTDKENSNTGSVNPTSPTTDEKTAINTERKVIKLSGLSVQERLELRSKKFNVDLPTEAKLEARAERFGLNTGTKSTGTDSGKPNTPGPDSEILKKRAERFGTLSAAAAATSSPVTASSTANPSGASLTSSSASAPSQADLEAKKRARAERFGLNSSSSSNGTTPTVLAESDKTSTAPPDDKVVEEAAVLVKRPQRFRIVI